MKFPCVSCDEPMKLNSAAAPDEAGSINTVFGCPSCSHQLAMLTNPYETQFVQSLGVKLGPGPKGVAAGGSHQAEGAQGGGCPSSGMLAEMDTQGTEVNWTSEALERLNNISEFVRPMARQGIEHYVKTNGYSLNDDALMEEARDRFGMQP